MPFTFAHLAIVVPLKKFKPVLFSTTGLIAGSLSPDFQYFLQMGAESDFSHTFAGVFLFDLPVSVLLAIGFHLWIRNVLIVSLPAPLDMKYASYLSFDFMYSLQKKWPQFLLSVFIGIVSHIYWDNLVKPEGWIYHLAPAFFGKTIYLGPTDFICYVLIERIESVLGLIFIAWFFMKHKQAINPEGSSLAARIKVCYWITLFVFAVLISGFKLWSDTSVDTLGQKIIIITSASLIALVITTALFKILLYQKQGMSSRI
jgi:hypothetical protein